MNSKFSAMNHLQIVKIIKILKKLKMITKPNHYLNAKPKKLYRKV